MTDPIKTPFTDPDHPTVGRIFKSYSINHNKPALYYCDSYDPNRGFWMTNVEDETDRRNVSERAIGRTYHRVYSAKADEMAEKCRKEVEAKVR